MSTRRLKRSAVIVAAALLSWFLCRQVTEAVGRFVTAWMAHRFVAATGHALYALLVFTIVVDLGRWHRKTWFNAAVKRWVG